MDNNQAVVLSRLFSSTVIRQLATCGTSPTLARLARLSDLDASKEESLGEYLERAYKRLSGSPLRDEYVYKNTLITKNLLGRHSLRTATVLSEFRVGTSKADLAIINGTSTVYEIKSERDNLSRLQGQLADYRKVFARIYVVAAQPHIKKLEALIDEDVGILMLKQKLNLSTIRKAADNTSNIEPVAICNALRRDEATSILKSLGRDVPVVPNTQIMGVLREAFAELTPLEAHRGMVEILGKTRGAQHLQTHVDALPPSLTSAVLTMSLRKRDLARLTETVSISMTTVSSWG